MSAFPTGGTAAPRRLALASLCLALALGGCNSAAPPSFDLTAPGQSSRLGGTRSQQIAVAEPAALQVLDGNQIIVKDASGAVSYVAGGQWSDRLPRLIQARLIQTFENTQSRYGVSRPGSRIVADYQLNTDLRAFDVSSATREAMVEMTAKLVDDRTGRIVRAKVFTGRAPVDLIDGPGASQALDRALAAVMLDMARWIARG